MPSEAIQTSGRATEEKPRKPRNVWVVLTYVTLILGLDYLGLRQDIRPEFGWLNWPTTVRYLFTMAPIPGILQPFIKSFDLYKFLFWFVIPVLWCWRGMDWKAWSKERWNKLEKRLLRLAIIVIPLSMFAIPYLPGIGQYYVSRGGFAENWDLALLQMLWTLAWLPGWEFMHRYLLLGAVHKKWPGNGWMLVPCFEFVYHLQKPPVEAGLMFVFGFLLTWYAVKRENFRFPFLIHLIVELSLIAWLTFF